MARFSLKDQRTEYVEKSGGHLIDLVFAGPDGKYDMQIRVMHNGASVFESHREIHFVAGEARLSITPVTDMPRDYTAYLSLTIDGDPLPAICSGDGVN